MTAGMKVWAQDGSGVLQIDNKYQNLFVRQKISAQSDFVEVANFSSGRFIDVRCLAFPVVAVGNSFPVSVEITQPDTSSNWQFSKWISKYDYGVWCGSPFNGHRNRCVILLSFLRSPTRISSKIDIHQ
ncbi:hypothetical protein [Xanthomonas hortorum]|uniref:hypothetical protein n=1 Tax=Xanthomonas hortorum TaxID=56454 RepID=UPI001E3C5EFC|nr:hypothetical protein [Xanthomonas hortorum]MCC8555466.1 hypothetical protein [Xanthomonas hortorum pv. gardneri]